MVLDHGRLLFAVVAAVLVTMAISTASGELQSIEFNRSMQLEQARLLDSPAAAPEEFLAAQSRVSRALSQRYFATGLKSLLLLAVVFVPFCILVLAAWDHLGGGFTILVRDYSPVLAGLLFAWTAAHLPFAVLWWSPLMPNLSLVVPFQLAALALFFLLAAPVLSTVTGATTAHSAIVSLFGVAVCALANTFLGSSGNLLYMFASPWLLYYAWQRFGGDISSLGGGLSERQNFKRQLELATINPHDADAQYQLGLLYVQRRLPAEAEQRFRRAMEIDPEEPEVLFQLGRLLRHQEGRGAEAKPLLEKAARINPKISSSEVWRELGAVALAAGDVDEALRILEYYTSVREYDPEGQVLFGNALRTAGQDAKAKAAFERAIEAVREAPAFRKGELSRWERQARQALRGR